MKFFQHNIDARSNPKLRKVLRDHGADGYAIWWTIIEALYANDGREIKADELWLEYFAELLCIKDHKTLVPVFQTFADLDLICPDRWAENAIWRNDIQKREQTHHIYRRHQSFVFNRDGFKCVYCGSTENLSLDHKIPQSRGGSHDPENLATCCLSCNSSKGAKTPQEWLEGVS